MRARAWSLGVVAAAALASIVLVLPSGAQERGPGRPPLAIGASLPSADVRMRGVDGAEITLGGTAGARGTLVVFTCNHCPWARAWEGRLTELGNAYRGRGIGVVAVNPNDPAEYPDDGFEEMQRRARTLGMQFPYVVDATSDVARSFGATRTPEVFLFDSARHLVYHGAIDDNSDDASAVQHRYLRDALEALLSRRAIAPAETRSIGCSIKWR